jgi:hypothetical protein
VKKIVLWAVVLSLVAGNALASYEKDAAALLKKNPNL